MDRVRRLVMAAMFLTAAAFPALAVEPSEGAGGVPGAHAPRGAEMQQPGNATGSAQRVNGTVTDINQSKGLVSLSSSDGTLKLHFPPQSIRDMKKGDKIAAQFTFAKAAPTEGSTRAYDAPKGLGEHRMTGTISKVDHDKGWLYVKTEHTTLELRFPPQAVHDLKTGDRVTVDLAFSRAS